MGTGRGDISLHGCIFLVAVFEFRVALLITFTVATVRLRRVGVLLNDSLLAVRIDRVKGLSLHK